MILAQKPLPLTKTAHVPEDPEIYPLLPDGWNIKPDRLPVFRPGTGIKR